MNLWGLDIYRIVVILCGGMVWYCGARAAEGQKMAKNEWISTGWNYLG